MKKNSKFLLIALPLALILAGLTVYEYGYLKVQSEVAALEESAWGKKKILKKYMAAIADRPRIEADLNRLTESRKADSSKIIEGQTPSIAATAIQSTVKGMILSRGGTIASERIEKPEDLGKFKIITIAVDAVLPDIRALNDTLYALGTQTPFLVVRELDTTIRNYQLPKELSIRLKISGLTGGR